MVNYYVDPLSENKIRRLLKKMGISAADLLRNKEPVFKKLELDRKKFPDDKLIELMAHYPDLIQRPIVEMGERAILARPAERIAGFLSTAAKGA